MDAHVTFIPGLILEFKLTHVWVVILWLKKAVSYYPYSVVVFSFFFLFTLKNLFLVLFFCKKHNPLTFLAHASNLFLSGASGSFCIFCIYFWFNFVLFLFYISLSISQAILFDDNPLFAHSYLVSCIPIQY